MSTAGPGRHALHAAATRHDYIHRVVTQSRGFPSRFKTADGNSLTQGRVCVPNVSSDMPTHDCHGHHSIAACCTSHSMPATADLPLALAVDLAVRHWTIFMATSGCRNTKLATSQITVHVPHLRSRYSAVGTVPRLRDVLSGVWIPEWTTGFSLLQTVQTVSPGPTQTPIQGVPDSFSGVMRPRRETDPSPLSTVEVKIE